MHTRPVGFKVVLPVCSSATSSRSSEYSSPYLRRCAAWLIRLQLLTSTANGYGQPATEENVRRRSWQCRAVGLTAASLAQRTCRVL